jgi:hypothetical protein
MFRSRTTRRRDQTNSSAGARRRFISRRLSVELMEGRLMLAATALNGLASAAESPLSSAQASLIAQPAEGGFINTNVASTAPRSHGMFSAGEVAIVFSNDQVTDQLFLGGVSQELHFNNYSPIDGNGLQPVAMASSISQGVFQTRLAPVVAGPTGSTPGPTEGGSIPIHMILADLRSDVGLASTRNSVSSLAAETSVDSLVSARRISTSDGAIAGEWARALVFEVAGGEPVATDVDTLREPRPTTSGSEETLKRREPLSSVELQQDGMTLANRHEAAKQAGEGSSDNGQAVQQSARSSGPISTAANPSNSAAVSRMAAGGEQSAGLSASNDSNDFGGENPGIPAAATAVAFDQLGEEKAAVIERAVDGKSWLRSIGTSPLLMMLALERIAALNSRRSTRESRIAAKKPLRLRT